MIVYNTMIYFKKSYSNAHEIYVHVDAFENRVLREELIYWNQINAYFALIVDFWRFHYKLMIKSRFYNLNCSFDVISFWKPITWLNILTQTPALGTYVGREWVFGTKIQLFCSQTNRFYVTPRSLSWNCFLRDTKYVTRIFKKTSSLKFSAQIFFKLLRNLSVLITCQIFKELLVPNMILIC